MARRIESYHLPRRQILHGATDSTSVYCLARLLSTLRTIQERHASREGMHNDSSYAPYFLPDLHLVGIALIMTRIEIIAHTPLVARMKRLLLGFLVLLLCVFVFTDANARRSSKPDIPEGYARLLVITNFENTEVQINNVSYPYEYIYADRQGVLLPADLPIHLRVSVSEEKTRNFRFTLKAGEMRVVVADIKNKGEVIAPPTPAQPAGGTKDSDEEDEATAGHLGVSSSPRGTVYIDDKSTGRKTPARRIELEPGRHRVQIEYAEGEMSETKYVLIRKGTNTNVFFRKRPSSND